ncbi:hypothetical protein [Sinorhizobium meliloti]|uniref:hypothetical protein n=1 Tax=Rhizobium meliloti TaxID=382 RepID=UPI0018658B9C|nr:hypothetical protein [Sinorhizobium meliloti]
MSEAAKRGRRNWSLEDKWRTVEEAQLFGIWVAEVARPRGLTYPFGDGRLAEVG